MSNRFGKIENGIVTNAILADDDFAQKNGYVKLTGSAGIGWKYANGQFSPPDPAPVVPDPVPTKAELLDRVQKLEDDARKLRQDIQRLP